MHDIQFLLVSHIIQIGGFGVSTVLPTSGTQTFIKNRNFLFHGCYAFPILDIHKLVQSTVSVFSTFLQFTWFSYVIQVAVMMAMTTENFLVSKVRWFSDLYQHRFYVHFQFLDFSFIVALLTQLTMRYLHYIHVKTTSTQEKIQLNINPPRS